MKISYTCKPNRTADKYNYEGALLKPGVYKWSVDPDGRIMIVIDSDNFNKRNTMIEVRGTMVNTVNGTLNGLFTLIEDEVVVTFRN